MFDIPLLINLFVSLIELKTSIKKRSNERTQVQI